MKLYLLQQTINHEYGTYDSCVVCAHDMDDARTIHPQGYGAVTQENVSLFNSWVGLKDVDVSEIGIAADGIERGVICSSFNAG